MIEDFHSSFTGDRIHLDANVFIYALEGFAEFAAISRGILEAMDRGLFQSITSELTLAEVLVHPLMKNDADIVETYKSLLRDQDHLALRPVTRSILEDSARIRARFGGSLPDAIHVATSTASGCDFIFTGDRTLRTPPEVRVMTLRELNEEYGLGPTS